MSSVPALRRDRVAFSLLGALLIVGWAGVGVAQPVAGEELVKAVRLSWEKRQESIASARVQLTRTELLPKGSISAQLPPSLTKPGDVQPSEDKRGKSDLTFLLDGNNARIIREGMVWNISQRQFSQDRTDTIIRSDTRRSLQKYGTQDWPNGRVAKDGWQTEADMTLWPLLLAFRGCDKAVVGENGVLGFTEVRQGQLGKGGLIELVRPRTEIRGERILSVDPTRGNGVVKYDMLNHAGSLTDRIAVTASREIRGHWMPVKWAIDSYSGSKLVGHTDVSVANIELNSGITEGDFTLEFPTGTHVIDTSTGKLEEYLMKQDGSKRVVLPGERSKSHDELMATETGALLPDRLRNSNWNWIYIAIGCVVILGTTLWWYRRGRGASVVS